MPDFDELTTASKRDLAHMPQTPDQGNPTGRHTLTGWPRRLFRRFWSSEVAGTAGLAAVVGALTGLGAVAFIEIISLCERLFFEGGAEAFSGLGDWYVVVLPVIGGAIVGPLVYFLAPEARGHGVPEVMTAMETRGGRIRPVVILVKTAASAITIGSGGAAGREGPIIQIGAAIGSSLGQVLKINRPRLLALVGAGAAGGIAATFNAPIAGVMFTLEVLVGGFSIASVSSMVFASVSASVVARQFLGDYPAFRVPVYELVSNWELLMYLGLGALAAFAALLFVRALYFSEDMFDKWKIPGWVKPPIAGVAIGLIGYFFPEVFGTGFTAIESALQGELAFWLLVALIFARIAATSLTLGSGFSGGVFAPALFVGAMLGGAYGELMHSLFPLITATSGAYATVGMAAVFAGAARAPVTAIVILFEMTLDYRIMLPLMFATVVATLLAARFEPESIYTLKLVRRGIDFLGQRSGRLPTMSVAEAMTPLNKAGVVDEDMSVDDLGRYFQESGRRGAMVLDAEGRLTGVVTLRDLERALVADRGPETVADIRTPEVITAFADEKSGRGGQTGRDVGGRLYPGGHPRSAPGTGRHPGAQRHHPCLWLRHLRTGSTPGQFRTTPRRARLRLASHRSGTRGGRSRGGTQAGRAQSSTGIGDRIHHPRRHGPGPSRRDQASGRGPDHRPRPRRQRRHPGPVAQGSQLPLERYPVEAPQAGLEHLLQSRTDIRPRSAGARSPRICSRGTPGGIGS